MHQLMLHVERSEAQNMSHQENDEQDLNNKYKPLIVVERYSKQKALIGEQR
jgi:hypothetical protein